MLYMNSYVDILFLGMMPMNMGMVQTTTVSTTYYF